MCWPARTPIELEGTYPLPEAQLDRFLFRLIFDNVDAEVLEQILLPTTAARGTAGADLAGWSAPTGNRFFTSMGDALPHLPAWPVARYVARLVSATHPGTAEATEPVEPLRREFNGASPHTRPSPSPYGEAARCWRSSPGRPAWALKRMWKTVAQPVFEPPDLILNYQARF